MTNNKEEPNSEYVSTPVDVEYGTTDPTEPEGNSKISCPSNPIRVSFPLNERPTPETDAEHAQFKMGGFTLDFCRKLERERDEARNKMADALQEVDLRTLDFERMKQERDEAHEELNDIRVNLGEDVQGYTLLHAVCALQNERDDLYYKLQDTKQSLEVALEDLSSVRKELQQWIETIKTPEVK